VKTPYTVLKNSRASLFKEAAFILARLRLYAAQAHIWHVFFLRMFAYTALYLSTIFATLP
jgi:hypothetical protein